MAAPPDVSAVGRAASADSVGLDDGAGSGTDAASSAGSDGKLSAAVGAINRQTTDMSALSSAPSMGRQMTELSHVDCLDIIDRQVRGFQAHDAEFWKRQCTTPAERQNLEVLGSMKRQMSAPNPHALQHRGSGLTAEKLAIIADEEPGVSSGSRQISHCDDLSLDTGLIETAVCTVITECAFSAAVADPDSLDQELIAVSEGFVQMCGYDHEEVIGKSCRFMSEGCSMPVDQRQRLQASVKSGAPFAEIVVNKRSNGELFLNLMDLRGLVIARNESSGEDIWVLMAVQADVTGLDPKQLPRDNLAALSQLASRIRKRVIKQLNSLGLAGAMMKFTITGAEEGGVWQLPSDVCWRSGELNEASVLRSLQELPEEYRKLLGAPVPAESPEGAPSAAQPAPHVSSVVAVPQSRWGALLGMCAMAALGIVIFDRVARWRRTRSMSGSAS